MSNAPALRPKAPTAGDQPAFPTTTIKPLSASGYDERWLQHRILENTQVLADILGANQLQLIAKERQQSSGGRLDLLFLDPEAETMYEVELMLGETDESHIVRTIEYWDIEKKRWPRKSHVAVLIAERINTRFYHVINLLSNAVPIVGIQANLVSLAGKDALHFTKIIDSYEEPELDQAGGEEITPERWKRNSPEQFEIIQLAVQWLSERSPIEVTYHESYVAIGLKGKHRVWIHWRQKGRVSFELQLPTEVDKAAVEGLLSQMAVDWKRRDRQVRWMAGMGEIQQNEAGYRAIFGHLVQAVA